MEWAMTRHDTKIQDWNYEATKLALKRAVAELPLPEEVIAQEGVVHHPLAAHDYRDEAPMKLRA